MTKNKELPLHNENEAEVLASSEQVFGLVDDHARLSAHMSQPSWRMGGARMETTVDEGQGQRIGSHIRMSARVLGLRLSLDEVITEREPPTRKVWRDRRDAAPARHRFVSNGIRNHAAGESMPTASVHRLCVARWVGEPLAWPDVRGLLRPLVYEEHGE